MLHEATGRKKIYQWNKNSLPTQFRTFLSTQRRKEREERVIKAIVDY